MTFVFLYLLFSGSCSPGCASHSLNSTCLFSLSLSFFISSLCSSSPLTLELFSFLSVWFGTFFHIHTMHSSWPFVAFSFGEQKRLKANGVEVLLSYQLIVCSILSTLFLLSVYIYLIDKKSRGNCFMRATWVLPCESSTTSRSPEAGLTERFVWAFMLSWSRRSGTYDSLHVWR